MKKLITLCADDYAFNNQTSDGIIELVKKNRISAVSCMTSMPLWKRTAEKLRPYANNVDVGLHFNLTDGVALTGDTLTLGGDCFQSLKSLITKCYFGITSLSEVKKELKHQLDEFRLHFGKEPDFIDGHQHIQQLPVIRDALVAIYQERFSENRAYIRVSTSSEVNSKSSSLKAFIIKMLGSKQLIKLLEQRDIPHNKYFSGIYDFDNASDYRSVFQRFLMDASNKTLIMCHPGLLSTDKNDCISASRWHEFQYFLSSEFTQDCEQLSAKLSKFNS